MEEGSSSSCGDGDCGSEDDTINGENCSMNAHLLPGNFIFFSSTKLWIQLGGMERYFHGLILNTLIWYFSSRKKPEETKRRQKMGTLWHCLRRQSHGSIKLQIIFSFHSSFSNSQPVERAKNETSNKTTIIILQNFIVIIMWFCYAWDTHRQKYKVGN